MMIINDPSHICGRRDILLEVAQKAIDLDYDGLMIESHIDPDNAWSDAKQQVTPEQLAEMLDTIIWRKEDVNSEEYHAALEKLRQQINHLDDELMQILSQRMKIAEKIGEYKKNNNITILQTNRWNEIIERAFQKGEKLGLSKEFITKYFDAVHMESINHQNKIMNSNQASIQLYHIVSTYSYWSIDNNEMYEPWQMHCIINFQIVRLIIISPMAFLI